MKEPRSQAVPNYGLYGESLESVDALGIHVEALSERSRAENWSIKPHFHGHLFQVICLLDGNVTAHLDSQSHTITACGLVTVPMGTVHEFAFTPDAEGFVITLADSVLTTIRQRQSASFFDDLLDSPAVVTLEQTDDVLRPLTSYLALMQQEFAQTQMGSKAALVLLSTLFLTTVSRQIASQKRHRVTKSPRLKMLEHFKQAVDANFKHHLGVSHYADALGVSVSTLNRVCRQQLGLTAKAVIAARLLTEAKRRLVYTHQPLDAIAYNLGYKDPAYFSRVFRKSEGLPPGAYRESVRNLESVPR